MNTNPEADDSQKRPPKPAPSQTAPVRTIPSEELLQGRQEVVIQHAGEIYRLRLTKNGKLILQK